MKLVEECPECNGDGLELIETIHRHCVMHIEDGQVISGECVAEDTDIMYVKCYLCQTEWSIEGFESDECIEGGTEE